jgi:DNA-binding NtrC family response regulator
MDNILIVTKDDEMISVLKKCLGADYIYENARDRKVGLAKFIKRQSSILFIDLSILTTADQSKTNIDYSQAFQPFREAFPLTPIVVMSPKNNIRELVRAVKGGANNYLTSPINPEEVRLVTESVSKAVRTHSELEYLRDQFWKDESRIIVRTLSPKMQKVFEQIRSVAPTLTTVLLTGETGTGKGVMAKLIHRHSRRSNNQFISVHCGAIPDTLIESELFGHEKGAFTGAIMRKLGKFEIAQGGTLFLDEIGTVTQSVQIKLLQVLQERIYSRVGGEATLKSDVRVIAASNSDLQAAIKEGTFREDLYYRLNVFPVAVPPLRERTEDIPMLVQEFLVKCNLNDNKNIGSVHPVVMEALRKYFWPGNIRELENLIERAHIVEQSRELTPESFPAELFSGGSTAQVHLNIALPLAEVRREAIESVERQYLKQLLAEYKGKIDVSALAAGLGVRQLHKLLTKYKIEKSEYKTLDRKRKKKQESEL